MTTGLPDIYFYNPTCEYAVANENISWQPNLLLQKMEADLAILPLYLSSNNDYILVDSIPSSNFLEYIFRLNISHPTFITKKEALHNKNFLNIQKNKLLPWGWSPAAHKLLEPLKKNCSENFTLSPVSRWRKESKELYSKNFAKEIQQRIRGEIEPEIRLPEEMQTQTCTTKEEIEHLLTRWEKLMTKAPWSSSGRGLQPITKTPVHPKVWEKIMGVIQEQGTIMVEPYLNKVMDLALQFEMKNGKIQFLGISRFITDKKGQYQGNFLNGFPDSLSSEVKMFANELPPKILSTLTKTLERSKLALFYEGFFGVDTLIFRDTDNKLKINPCLEINVRQNMGLLSLHLEKLIVPEKKGLYKTYYHPSKSYFIFKQEMEKQFPLELSGNLIKSGFISLVEAKPDTLFGAYILV